MVYLPPCVSFTLILPALAAPTFRHAIKDLSKTIGAEIGIGARILQNRFLSHETQKAAMVSNGVFLVQMPVSSLSEPYIALARLKTPIDCNASDRRFVDLFCARLTPAKKGAQDLQTLARLSRLLGDQGVCQKLRACEDERAMRDLLEGGAVRRNAA